MRERVQVMGPGHGKLEFFDPAENETIGRIFHPDEFAVSKSRTELMTAVARMSVATYDWEYRDKEQRGKVLADLREHGASLVSALAGDRPRGDLIDILSDTNHLTCNTDFHLPWEFLYLGDPNGEVSVSKFFGSNAVVGKHFSSTSTRRSLPSTLLGDRGPLTRFPVSSAIEFRYAEDIRLPSARSGAERAIFARLGIRTINLPSLISGNAASFSSLQAFVSASEHVTHFNCHAEPEVPAATHGAIYVTDTFKIDQTSIGTFELNEASIVVLYCCDGHTMRHDVQDTLASKFRSKRVEAVVATTGEIEDAYASRWAEHFYRALCAGETVPQSLLAARKAMLSEEDANPSALLYAYIGRPTASLRQKLVA
jgi:hypothetical protein